MHSGRAPGRRSDSSASSSGLVLLAVWRVAGQTAGARLIGVAAQRSASRVDLPTAGVRALRSALPDVQVFEEPFRPGAVLHRKR